MPRIMFDQAAPIRLRLFFDASALDLRIEKKLERQTI